MAKLLCLARFDYTFLFYSVKSFVIILQGTIDYVERKSFWILSMKLLMTLRLKPVVK